MTSYAQRLWWEKHGPEARKRQYKQQNRLKEKYRSEVLAKHGNKCSRCGFSDVRALQLHHVNGDGMKHKKKYHFNYQYWKLVLDDTTGAWELLCANCHLIHHTEQE
jgi:hypothetical protein